MFTEIYKWLFSVDNLCILHSRRDSDIDRSVISIVKTATGKDTVLVLDLDGRIQSIPPRWKLLRVTTLEQQIKLTLKLPLYINPRLTLIYISGFPTFLGDFRGYSALKTAVNNRVATFLISILKEISKEVKVLVKTYQTADGRPSYSTACIYYSTNIISVDRDKDSFEFQRNGETVTL